MTEPDEALLWARERAARWQDEGGGEAGPAYRRGDLDFFLGDEVEGYRAGSAASAERIKELEARVAELEWALLETIAEVSNHLPDSAKQHNLQAAIKALKRSESFPCATEAEARALLKEPRND